MMIAESVTYDTSVSVSKKGYEALLRYPTEYEQEVISKELDNSISKFIKKHKQKGLNSKTPEDIKEYILKELIVVHIDESYLLGLSLCEPWFAHDKILCEEFLIRTGGKAKLDSVMNVLNEVARRHGANKTAVGTLAATDTISHSSLSKLYEGYGFVVQEHTLWRDTYGLR